MQAIFTRPVQFGKTLFFAKKQAQDVPKSVSDHWYFKKLVELKDIIVVPATEAEAKAAAAAPAKPAK